MSWFNWTDFTKKASEVAKSATDAAVEAAKVAADTSKVIATQVNEKVNQFVEEQKKEYNAMEQESDLSRRKKTKKELMMESGVPPWWIDDTNNNQLQLELYDELKLNILKLCQDENNFLIKAPSSASVFGFKLDYALSYANKALQEDPILPKIRFKMVPRRLTEEQFWKNYFYRVNVIRESLGIEKMDFSAPPIPTTPSTSSPKESKDVSFPKNDTNNASNPVNAQNDNENKEDSVSNQIEGNIGVIEREKSQSISKSKSELHASEPESKPEQQQEIKLDPNGIDLHNIMEPPSSEQITEMESYNINNIHEDEDFLADDIDVGTLSETERAKLTKELGIGGIDGEDDTVENVDDLLAEVNADDLDDMSDGALQAELENI